MGFRGANSELLSSSLFILILIVAFTSIHSATVCLLPRVVRMESTGLGSSQDVSFSDRIFECRQRQVFEIEALSAIYDQSLVMGEHEKEEFEILKIAIESCTRSEDFSNEGMPKSLSFRIHQCCDVPGLSHTVCFTFPTYYPLKPCSARIEWDHGKRGDNAHLTATLQQYAESMVGEESGMQLVKVSAARVRAFGAS